MVRSRTGPYSDSMNKLNAALRYLALDARTINNRRKYE